MQLLGDFARGPRRRRQLLDLLDRQLRRTILCAEVEPIPSGHVVLANDRWLMPRSVNQTQQLPPELSATPCIHGVEHHLPQARARRSHNEPIASVASPTKAAPSPSAAGTTSHRCPCHNRRPTASVIPSSNQPLDVLTGPPPTTMTEGVCAWASATSACSKNRRYDATACRAVSSPRDQCMSSSGTSAAAQPAVRAASNKRSAAQSASIVPRPPLLSRGPSSGDAIGMCPPINPPPHGPSLTGRPPSTTATPIPVPMVITTTRWCPAPAPAV